MSAHETSPRTSGRAPICPQPADIDARPEREERHAEQDGAQIVDAGDRMVGDHAEARNYDHRDERDDERRHDRRPRLGPPAPGRPMANRDAGDQRGEQHHARELHHDCRRERSSAGRGRRRDDLGDVVHARPDPGAELLVVEPEWGLEQRERDDREGAAEGHERDGERDLVLVRVDDAVCRCDRGDTADREAGGDEEREVVGDAEPGARPSACRRT